MNNTRPSRFKLCIALFVTTIALIIWPATLPISSNSARPAATAVKPATVIEPAPASLSLGSKPARSFTAAVPFAPVITATKSDALLEDADADGTADPGDKLKYTVTITNSGDMAATGVSFTDTIDPNTTLVPGSVDTSPLAANDSYTAIGNVSISPNAAQGMLANDTDPDGGGLTVTSTNTAGLQGDLTFNPNGSFTFNPNPGFEGTTSFTYTVTDSDSNSATATVTITVSGMIWFVDDDDPTPGGDGRLTNPFNALTGGGSFEAVAADDPGDNIFLFSGNYVGGLTLLANQRLLGQGSSASLSAMTGLTPQPYSAALPATGGASPVISASVNNIVLATGNTVRGVTLSNAGATALIGNGFGTLTVEDTIVNNTNGVAISLINGTLAANFRSVSASGGTNGIALQTTTGSFAVVGTAAPDSGGTIQNTTGDAVSLNNTSGVSLNRIKILNPGDHGINSLNSSGFTITNSTITDNAGNTVAGDNDQNSINFVGLTGTNTINNVTFNGINEDGIRLVNSGGTLAGLTVSDSVFIDHRPENGENGINITTNNSANITVTVDNCTFTIDADGANGVIATTNSTASGAINITVQNSTFNAATAFGQGTITLNNDGTSVSTYKTLNNTFLQAPFNGIAMKADGGSTLTAVIEDNTMTATPTNAGTGISVTADANVATDAPKATISIQNNNVAAGFFQGIVAELRDSGNAAARLNVTVNNNTVGIPSGSLTHGIRIRSRQSGTACSRLSGNISTGNGVEGIRLQQTNPSIFNLERGTAALSDSPTTVLTTNNPASTALVTGTVGVVENGTCVAAPAPIAPDYDALTASPQDGEIEKRLAKDTLRATGGESAIEKTVADLTQNELHHTVRAAIERLKALGLAEEAVARLESLPIEIVDLPDDDLATATAKLIQIDRTAAGYGWFVDYSPEDNAEYERVEGYNEYKAGLTASAYDQMDLLTVVVRELAFVLEQGDPSYSVRLRRLSINTLPASTRRLPEERVIPNHKSDEPDTNPKNPRAGSSVSVNTPDEREAAPEQNRPASAFGSRLLNVAGPGGYAARAINAAITRPLAGGASSLMSGETVNLTIGTLPAGASVTITFEVTINDPMPVGVCEVANQGTVTADGGISVLTDDPDTGAPNDPTRTSVPTTPTITCPANITVNNAAGQCSASVSFNVTATGCPTPTITCKDQNNNVITSPNNFPAGITTVTCTASNGPDSDATCSFTVTVNDTEPPSQITCPANITTTESPTGSGSATVTYVTPTATDNCSVTVTCAPASGSSFPVGTTTVNCTAADPAGNSTTCSFIVTVVAACQISCPSNITVSNDPNQCGAVVNYPVPTTTGECGNVTCSPTDGSFFPKGTTTVNCTTTTGPGCSFTITVNDTEPPSITCPGNISRPTGTGCVVVNYAPTVDDNCPGVGTPVCNPPSGTCFNPGTTTVTCNVADASGNTNSCTFTVTVDECAISCPASITKNNDPNQCGAIVNYPVPTTTGDCGNVTCSPSSGSFFPKGTTSVNCTTSVGPACSFTVTVNDSQSPTITCPSNITKGTDPGECSAVVSYTATAADNCPGVTVTCSPPSGSTFPKGTSTVNCTATDTSGNTSHCSFTVTVNDTQPPTIVCPPNIAVGTTPNQCTAVVTYPGPAVTDNCPGVGQSSCSPPSGSTFPKGTTIVTCMVADASGNTSSCSFTVTVNDTQAPSLICNVADDDLWPPNHDLVNVGLSVTATDNCTANPIVSVQVFSDEDDQAPTGEGNFSPDAKDIAPVTLRLRSERDANSNGRVYLIIVTATDSSGNVSRCCKTVTVAKSRSGANVQNVAAQAAAALAHCQQHGTAPPNYFLVGDGPIVGPKQ